MEYVHEVANIRSRDLSPGRSDKRGVAAARGRAVDARDVSLFVRYLSHLGSAPPPPPRAHPAVNHARRLPNILRRWNNAGMKTGNVKRSVAGRGELSEKTRRSAASSGTIPTYENPGATPPGIDPASRRWEASSLTTTPPRPQRAWATVAVRLDCSHPTMANRVQSTAGYSGFSQVGIVPDDAAGRQVFSGISHFPRPSFHSGAAPFPPRFTLIGSQYLDFYRERPLSCARPRKTDCKAGASRMIALKQVKPRGVRRGLRPHTQSPFHPRSIRLSPRAGDPISGPCSGRYATAATPPPRPPQARANYSIRDPWRSPPTLPPQGTSYFPTEHVSSLRHQVTSQHTMRLHDLRIARLSNENPYSNNALPACGGFSKKCITNILERGLKETSGNDSTAKSTLAITMPSEESTTQDVARNVLAGQQPLFSHAHMDGNHAEAEFEAWSIWTEADLHPVKPTSLGMNCTESGEAMEFRSGGRLGKREWREAVVMGVEGGWEWREAGVMGVEGGWGNGSGGRLREIGLMGVEGDWRNGSGGLAEVRGVEGGWVNGSGGRLGKREWREAGVMGVEGGWANTNRGRLGSNFKNVYSGRQLSGRVSARENGKRSPQRKRENGVKGKALKTRELKRPDTCRPQCCP
ncbi:hypothetical protein PR048_021977 [Dryococelus australis]|uniref:Uncharacterized protein n=1 Tax=Dryococelus australis TaxID=614101 RepID=A0ABQ9GZU3_9NEOP|nr:hypothetical protein PR048_021977 [Dryococelus australis]